MQVGDQQVFISGTLCLCMADNLGSHSVGGFMESFSANKSCGFCMTSLEDFQTQVYNFT